MIDFNTMLNDMLNDMLKTVLASAVEQTIQQQKDTIQSLINQINDLNSRIDVFERATERTLSEVNLNTIALDAAQAVVETDSFNRKIADAVDDYMRNNSLDDMFESADFDSAVRSAIRDCL